jgi:Mg2+ and Co2+ transporter CorA
MHLKPMPELEWRCFAVWLVMGIFIIGMLYYIKKKKWF